MAPNNVKIETSGYGDDVVKDMAVGKQVMDILEDKYPLHPWFVNCSHEAGTVTIQLMYEGADKKLRVWRYGFLLHLNKLKGHDDMQRRVMLAGGEVLERYNMARAQASENDIMNFMRLDVDTGSMVL